MNLLKIQFFIRIGYSYAEIRVLRQFQAILFRSTAPRLAWPQNKYRLWAYRTVSHLKIHQEVWLCLISRCGDLPGEHLMVLKVYKTSLETFRLTLVNVGYGAVLDKRNPGFCRDLALYHVKEDHSFYSKLDQMLTVHRDVPDCYEIMRKMKPGHLQQACKRPLIYLPLCATETLRRCYKDFLGKRLYASWIGWWAGQELNIIESRIRDGGIETITALDKGSSPKHLRTAPSFAAFGKIIKAPTADPSLVPTMGRHEIDSFLRGIALTQIKYLSAATHRLKADDYPLTVRKILRCEEEGWVIILKKRHFCIS
jgi:hypothetical protein